MKPTLTHENIWKDIHFKFDLYFTNNFDGLWVEVGELDKYLLWGDTTKLIQKYLPSVIEE